MAFPTMIAARLRAGAAGLGMCLGSIMMPEAEAAHSIRVLLAPDVQQLEVHTDQTIWVTDEHDQAWFYRPILRIKVRGHALILNGKPVVSDRLTLRAGNHDLKLWVNGNGKRTAFHASDDKGSWQVSGLIQLVRRGKGLLLINHVDLEEYVKGVVPAEVSTAWHPEMLKVQAVAARTYALYQHMLSSTRDYDVVAGIQDQVYRGRQGIDTRVMEAVESTRGLVVTYQGAPIYAAFSSTAAGVTEDAMIVWSKDLPYLKGVECPFDLESPYYQWKASRPSPRFPIAVPGEWRRYGSCTRTESWFYGAKICVKRWDIQWYPVRNLQLSRLGRKSFSPATEPATRSVSASGARNSWRSWAIRFRAFLVTTILERSFGMSH
jgi:stage II sporulation protein D